YHTPPAPGPLPPPPPNWKHQTIWTGDNLDIMRGMNSASVDLIYLDPPFNSNHDYAAPIGSKAAGAAFKDTWGLDDVNVAWHGEIKHEHPGLYALLTATRDINGASMMSYLIYMAIRLMEMRRLLKPTGSIYLHCDPYASHYLKLLMDALFGKAAFRNEIVWGYRGPGGPKMRQFNRKHDIIFWYSRDWRGAWTFNADAVRLPHHGKTIANYKEGLNGSGHADTPLRAGKVPETWWVEEKGNGLAIAAKQKGQHIGYPTQKPLALLRRIIRASSNEGDLVLDPFCGCATACIAAEMEGREWAGIDIAPKAADLVQSRMRDELGLFYRGAHRTDIPERSDLGEVIPYNAPRNKAYLYGEQGGYCNGCEEHFQPRNLTVDHIVPRARGGTDHISNLQLLCAACNAMKGTRSHEHLLACLTDKGWVKRKNAA
ncbi:MAG: DNA methyltransferase, partial [Gammaproteobacteria bacterium]|nr:DNA methyltransferase [Gammaproteobacteria bacterium]